MVGEDAAVCYLQIEAMGYYLFIKSSVSSSADGRCKAKFYGYLKRRLWS